VLKNPELLSFQMSPRLPIAAVTKSAVGLRNHSVLSVDQRRR